MPGLLGCTEKKDRGHYLKIIFLKFVDVFTPEEIIFVNWRPVKMAKEDFLFILLKRTQLLDVVLQCFF